MRSTFIQGASLLVASILLTTACSSSSNETDIAASDDRSGSAQVADSRTDGEQTRSGAGAESDSDDRTNGDAASAAEANAACPSAEGASTNAILGSLADDFRSAGETDMAERLSGLAADLEGGEPTAETLADTMRVLTEVGDQLDGQPHGGCLGLLSNSLQRADGISGAAGLADSTEAAASSEDLVPTIERGFGLPEEDASCVVDELEADAGGQADASAIDDIDVLVALSTCANRP